MGVMGYVLALFTLGYIVGVWTACLVLRQPQRSYEDSGPIPTMAGPVIVLDAEPQRVRRGG
jgi:hypothetical protein